jgi:hypothetical protein
MFNYDLLCTCNQQLKPYPKNLIPRRTSSQAVLLLEAMQFSAPSPRHLGVWAMECLTAAFFAERSLMIITITISIIIIIISITIIIILVIIVIVVNMLLNQIFREYSEPVWGLRQSTNVVGCVDVVFLSIDTLDDE